MNDISVKIVESPKEVMLDGSPVVESGGNDVDPLAIDEEVRVREGDVGTPVDVTAVACLDNAKDEIESGVRSEDGTSLALDTEKFEEELLKDDPMDTEFDDSATVNNATDKELPKTADLDTYTPAPDLDPESAPETEKVFVDVKAPEILEPERQEVLETAAIAEKEITPEKEVETKVQEEVKQLEVSSEENKEQEVQKAIEINKPEVTEIPAVVQNPVLSQTLTVKPPEALQVEQVPKQQESNIKELLKALGVTKVSLPEPSKSQEIVRPFEGIKVKEVYKLQQIAKTPEVSKLQEVLKALEAAKTTVKIPQGLKSLELLKEQEVLKVPSVLKTESVPQEILKHKTLESEVGKVSKEQRNIKSDEMVSTDVEMSEEKQYSLPAAAEKPKVDKKEKMDKTMPVNGDLAKEEQAAKRRASADIDTESPLKRLCLEVESTFPQHDSMINEYIQTATKNNIDEIQRHTEQLLAEIQTLRELAQKKEHEWNNILHLKKVKEEILLRLLRRKQVLSFEKSAEMNGSERTDPFEFLNQAKNLAIDKSDEISGLAIKQPGSTMNPMVQPVMPVTTHFNPMAGLPPPYDKAGHMHNMPNMNKPMYPQPMMMPGPMGNMPGFPRDMNGQLPTSFGIPMGRQGPTKDVKSIIADYRQRNPDITPRRGRRMKSLLNPNMMNPRPIAPKVDGMNNMNNMNNMNLNNLNMLFNNLDMNQKAMLERLQQMQAGNLPNSIFKDALVQFANMQQASSGLIPNRVETVTNRQEHHKERRRPERPHEEHKQPERLPSTSPRLPPPPPYPEISLLPVTTSQETSHTQQQNSLLHGILTKHAPAQSYSPTLAKLLTSPERQQALPTFGQAKNCGEITITPVQPTPPPEPQQPEKPEEVVQLDDEESPPSESEAVASPSGSGRLVIDEGGAEAAETPLCQGCKRRDAQFVCAGCANQWYCSRDCQVAAWDEHSDMCSG